MQQRAKSPIRAIRNGTAVRVQPGAFHDLEIGRARFRSSSLGRVLVVLAATILVLIVSAIVLPPGGRQIRSGGGGGEAPVTAPH